ncbi:pilus assembly protein [Pseudorhodoferax soli]|uniref:Type IV pilus assembly protein PilY1 n=1 Tax=Pseudorhodoferax soli TaxID=545864 RepID=A0A368YBQ5_9BURK|nr:PilC/PilY family type IV pilus protein [Pseudorhodoferax soli]RCW76287.1 type IV pilus assembly protein PilY1 [Pseudorhodoferax soli]
MRPHPQARRTLLSVLIASMGLPPVAFAEQLPLAQYPAGSSSRQPAPNVILTLDDSGSMGYYTNGGTTQNETRITSRMYALKSALRQLFDPGAQNIPDGSIRLAWNTMNTCRSIPSATGGCNNLNRMRVLDATHRANFLNWVGQPGAASSPNTRLSASGSTPTHHAYIAAGDYLRNGSVTDAESPWANVPGSVAFTAPATTPLSCRKSYNVMMTDGGWNFTFAGFGTDVARPTTNADLDRTRLTLPDDAGTVYDVNSRQTAVYRGAGGRSFTYSGKSVPVSTLADLAFYYWSTDLAPGLANNVLPRIKQSTGQTFRSGLIELEVEPFWNPRNDPATWQHMTTYTIGFGDAARWKTTGTFALYPVWDLATNDTYGGSLPDLVTGVRAWPDPMVNNSVSLTESSNLLDALTTNGEARKTELWHMAINSRGKFIASTDAASLVAAFREIFSEIIADSSTPVASYANASASIARNPTTQYTASYIASAVREGETLTWMGSLRADTVAQNINTGAVTTTATEGWGTANRTTADKLDLLSASDITNRLILTWADGSPAGGTSFQWTQDATPTLPALSAGQKTLLKAEGVGEVAEAVAVQRLNFLRGDRSLEGTTFRKRGSRQGDTVNSALWYVADPVGNYTFDSYRAFANRHAKRLPMLYVGANDGMLHGFSGADGSEKIAYVPRGVYANLPDLTRSAYGHRYYVDGSPFSGDVNLGNTSTPDWRTLLVGTLGAGGKGYFVLDVTNPGSIATDNTAQASNFSKANAATLVVMDKTAAAAETYADANDARRDIGHITTAPVVEDGNAQKTTQIVRMNNGRWAVVMGNGYNSTSERPVLLVQYLDGDKALVRIAAATTGPNASGNGLSAPGLVDIDGNGTPDVIYAGDLRGNMWKFDVGSATASEWNVAFSGAPLYSTVGNLNTPQPIVAPPIVRANQRGAKGLMVAFGTGRNLTEADRTDVSVQSIYSVLDGTQYKLQSGKVVVDGTATPVGSGVTNLVQQSVDATAIAGSGLSSARTFFTVTQNEVPYSGDNQKKGWYLHLPAAGERVVAQMSFFDDSNIIELISEIPAAGGNTADESCLPPSTELKKYRTLLNIMDGKRPSIQVMDTNGDGEYLSSGVKSDLNTSRMTASGAENGVTTKAEQVRMGSDNRTDKLKRMPEIPLRPNWRQLQ